MPTAAAVLAALLIASCQPAVEEPPPEPARADSIVREVVEERFEAYLQRMIEEERFAGVALVIDDGEVLHAKGYGKATPETGNAVDTEFHVASVTKQFTAAATLQLVERGLIELDVSINEYLPEIYRSPNWDVVTVHHLLSHSSGVPDYALTRDYYDVVDGFCLGDTVDGMVKEAMGRALEFEPGSRYTYSNIGFTLLGLIISHQTGTPYDEYLKANVLDPMGMTSSRVHIIGHVPTEHEAAGHRWDEELGAHAHDAVVTLPVTAPDGGLVTTLSDFARWTGIYTGGEQTVLSGSSLERMLTPVVESDETHGRGSSASYGYGLFLGDGLISHAGYIVGFRSHFILDLENDALIVVFSNNTTNDPSRITSGLLEILDSPRS